MHQVNGDVVCTVVVVAVGGVLALDLVVGDEARLVANRLDRGELDKLIQLSSSPAPVAELPRAAAPRTGKRDFEDSDYGKHQQGGYRKKSWLSDIFD